LSHVILDYWERSVQMQLRDDVETEQIGRLIDAGHPELAARTFRARWRYRWLTRLIAAISLAVAGAWHWH